MDSVIKNAKITSTHLSREDHGIFTFVIYIEIQNGGCCGIGTYALDSYNAEKDERELRAESCEILAKILDVVGVEKWEDLPGKYIRIIDNGWGSIIDCIGNLMCDKWLNFKDFFEKKGSN